ncbi:RuBisCO large subunit C-terminal-like domain-containing protein, partial [Paenibacillus sp. MCAF20]
HPDGAAAGFESMKLAWEAAVANVPLEQCAEQHQVVQRAIDKFGRAGQ